MTKEFWNSRASSEKTTGYSDYSVAFFDQLMRLKVIERVLDEYIALDLKKATVLDFGCGKGDFVSYFSDKVAFVVGYDISQEILELARENCANISNVLLTNSLNEIDLEFDVVLSVTVMQHILDDNELSSVLSVLSTKCKQNAVVAALETLECNGFDLPALPHLKVRKLEDLAALFERSDFRIVSVRPFYNPFLIRTPSYIEYRKKVRLFRYAYRLIGKSGANPAIFNGVFKRRAEDVLSKEQNIDGLIEGKSFSNIIIIKKGAHGSP